MDYKRIIREKLGDERYTHSINVAQKCAELSICHSVTPEIAEKAYAAGILHDVMKELPRNELWLMVVESGLRPDSAELNSHKLWHGIAGAKYVRDALGIDDKEIINAIRYHTTARSNMSVVEKIVYLADKISDDREYDGVKKIRAAANENLDLGVYLAIKKGIKKVIKKDTPISLYTFGAYNFYSQGGTG